MKLTLTSVRKFIVAAIGMAAEIVNAGLVHGTAAHYAAMAVAVATAIGVYVVPNGGSQASQPSTPADQAAPATTK